MFSFVAAVLTFAALLLSLADADAADTERVLESLDGISAGAPYGLVADASGSLYGVGNPTSSHKNGTIFRLRKASDGRWGMAVLYEFKGWTDGSFPSNYLIFDSTGNIYGTTAYAGGVTGCSCGIVFELTPTASGPWKETTLYSFKGGTDGAVPVSGVSAAADGNFYGTTTTGGQPYNSGTVFKLSPISGGGWSESVIYNFQGGSDGADPIAQLVLDKRGNFFGLTGFGGSSACPNGCGTIFEISPDSGSWSEKVIYVFTNGADGVPGLAALAIDDAGNLYGATPNGGDVSGCNGAGCGAVFELSRDSQGGWSFTTLYSFLDGNDGASPEATLAVTRAGHIYGATSGGGMPCLCGTVFELSPNSGGGWVETILYTFAGGNDGELPYGGFLRSSAGSLYGTTLAGGTANKGTVFEIIP